MRRIFIAAPIFQTLSGKLSWSHYTELLSVSEDMAIIIIKIRKSKTDQTRKGRKIGISFGSNKTTCPITALLNWLEVSEIRESALFRPINQWGQLLYTRLTDQSVRLILRESLKLAGISTKGFSGHSLRAGFATVAAINGASEREIQKTTGHMNLEVLRRYIRDGDMFRENASKRLGL